MRQRKEALPARAGVVQMNLDAQLPGQAKAWPGHLPEMKAAKLIKKGSPEATQARRGKVKKKTSVAPRNGVEKWKTDFQANQANARTARQKFNALFQTA